MNELILKKDSMTSLEVAEITGKRHADVMRDIRNLIEQLDYEGKRTFALSSYVSEQGKELPMYLLNEDACLCLASGYDANLRMKIIKRWKELEVSNTPKLPQTFAEALQLAADQAKLIEVKNQQLLELKPKALYYDTVISSVDAVTISVIAKDYGLTAPFLNKKLYDLRIQYKQGNIWLLYDEYAAMGYTKTSTTTFKHKDGRDGTSVLTKWTQRGRLFLYELLKQNGILPLIEQ